MTQMGMDVEAVENVGRQLKQSATSVDAIVGTLDKTVSGLAQLWNGPDAQHLIQSWPNFRKSLVAAQASIAGLGQSALNNASEQRQASGAQGSGGGGGISSVGTHNSDSGSPNHPSDAAVESGTPGRTAGSLPPGDVAAYRSFEHSTSHYNSSVGYKVDANGKGVDNCTAWVDWRREQLGLSPVGGEGGQMAHNLGGDASTPPTLGAAVSYYPPGLNGAPNPSGHVMLVEEIFHTNPPSFRVSEDNFSNAYKDSRVWTQQPDGRWQADGRGPSYALEISPGKS